MGRSDGEGEGERVSNTEEVEACRWRLCPIVSQVDELTWSEKRNMDSRLYSCHWCNYTCVIVFSKQQLNSEFDGNLIRANGDLKWADGDLKWELTATWSWIDGYFTATQSDGNLTQWWLNADLVQVATQPSSNLIQPKLTLQWCKSVQGQENVKEFVHNHQNRSKRSKRIMGNEQTEKKRKKTLDDDLNPGLIPTVDEEQYEV